MKIIIVATVLALAQPAPATKGVRLERLSSGDAQVALNADAVVVIPLGAGLQPHGAHLGVGTDLVLAEHVAHRVMKATAVSVAPPIAYHFSTATELSASATLSLETARDMTLEVVRTLSRSGPRPFLL